MFKLPSFDYESLAKSNFITMETIQFHVFQHHQTYVTNLNKFIEETPALQNLSLEEIVLKSEGGIFNNAAQIWNHSFYWNCIATAPNQACPADLQTAINSQFGSIEKFKEEFKKLALANFGSGWTWLVKNKADNKLEIVNTSNAAVPFKLNSNHIPLLVCDVWEHAYYIDFRNKRAAYVDSFLNHINWHWVEKCFKDSTIQALGAK